MTQRIIEVCYSPPLFPFVNFDGNWIIVVADVLRATTTICTAFDYKAYKVIPVETVDEAIEFKKQGYFVAGERGGVKLSLADAGNSPLEMMTPQIEGKTIILTTTNGTRAIKMAAEKAATVIGAFVNLIILKKWLLQQTENVLIVCAGWNNLISLEDILFAGALTEELIKDNNFYFQNDEACLALEMWKLAKNNTMSFILKGSHSKRLIAIGQDDSLEHCFKIGISQAIPVFIDGAVININV